MGQMMLGNNSPLEERERSAAWFATVLYDNVRSRLPRETYENDLNADAINERRSASILEFGLRGWPEHYRMSIHSDKQCSIVGYGVFRPRRVNWPFTHDQLANDLAALVPGGRRTNVLWAWYTEMDQPLRDFSRPETLIEVEKIRRGEASKGDDAFRKASEHLAKLAEALHGWYSKISGIPKVSHS